MAGIFDYGGNLYDIDDLKIARNLGDGTFGDLVDVPSIDMFRIEFVTKNQTGRGDGGITALASAIESCNITIRNLGIKRDQITYMFPADSYETGVEPDREEMTDIESGRPFPYFGAIARIFDGESDDAGALIFVPRIKIMQNITWNVEYNTFVAPEMTAMAVRDPVLLTTSGRNRFVRAIFYESELPAITAMPI